MRLNYNQVSVNAMHDKDFLEFGPFRLDTRTRLLFQGQKAVTVPAKALDVLLHLLRRPGETVSKNELMQAVWPDTFVEDGNLTQMIFLLRKALGESEGGLPYIVTVPRQGYRFAGKLKQQLDSSSSRTRKRRLGIWVSVSGLAALAAIGIWLMAGSSDPQPAISGIAVFPFEDVSAEKNMAYFCAGIADELIESLSQIPGLTVTTRASALGFKRQNSDFRRAGASLGVQAVLDGTVRRERDQLRITTELLNVQDGSRIWSKTYEGSTGNIFAVQRAIARKVAETLRIRAGGSSYTPKRYTADLATYDLYLKGRAASNPREAAVYFQQAVERDPKYAPAYSGLSDAYQAGDFAGLTPDEAQSRASEAVDIALTLDDRLAEAHFSKASILSRNWEWGAALAEIERAIELAPSFGPALWQKGHLLLFAGREFEAAAAYQRAEVVDPMAPYTIPFKLQSLLYLRRFDELIEFAMRHPLDLSATYYIARAYTEKGLTEKAIQAFEKYRRQSTRPWQGFGALAGTYVRAGRRSEALRILAEVRSIAKNGYVKPTSMAQLYIGLGNLDEAFRWLERAVQEYDSTVSTLKVEPCWDSVRDDPRFGALLEKVNLKQ